MPSSHEEVEHRRRIAFEAIQRSSGDGVKEDSVGVFISHHLKEIGSAFWSKHCKTEHPSPSQVIDILILQSHWGDDDEEEGGEGIQHFDFTLPDDVTHYVISVSFEENGEISGIEMES